MTPSEIRQILSAAKPGEPVKLAVPHGTSSRTFHSRVNRAASSVCGVGLYRCEMIARETMIIHRLAK